ncbi:MAG: hypothetical protein AUG51_24840 [Acidobacteria bacterium 13_1_20CM_3_53_8]|nr:MAG: hypothetical protein AUG51_24840 [Acidobacteria bacterium 13_1_20CM_3_53_8]
MSLTGKVTSGVSWLGAAFVAQRLTILVVTAILARQLSPEDFGLIALTLLAVNFITYFQDMGLSSALVQRKELDNDHLSTTFWLNAAAGVALGIIGCGLSPLIALIFREPRLTPLLIAMMLTLPINGLGWASNALLQRKLVFKQISLIECTAVLISGVVAVMLAFAGAGVWALVSQNITMSLANTGGRIIAARWLPRFTFSIQRARELFSFSLSAFGYFLTYHGIRNIDNAIVGGVLGATALGYYALAYNLILIPGISICGLIGRVMFPALSSVQDDLARFRRAYLRMARTVTAATFPLIIGLWATAPLFVTTIYGEKWIAVIPLLRILSVIGFFEAISIWGMAAWALGKTKITFHMALVSLAAMTVAFIVGVRWGLLGVAWAYIIVSPIIFLLPHLLTNHLMKLRMPSLLKAIAPPFCASSVMGIAVWFLIARGIQFFTSRWMNLLSFIVIGGVIYFATLIVLAIANRPEGGIISWVMGQHLGEIDAPHTQIVNS